MKTTMKRAGVLSVSALLLSGLLVLTTGASARSAAARCGAGTDVGGKLFIIGHDAPAWSPDGTKIAFTGFTPAACGTGDIYVSDTNGRNPKRLTTTPGNDDLASWSPDSTKILFVSDRDSPTRTGNLPTEIYVMNADGSGQTRLTHTPTLSEFPARFSPDGKKIVFVRNSNIWVMNADGTNEKQLTNISNRQDAWPDWSPDGTKIVFERQFVEPKLTVMNADGTDVHRVTTSEESAVDERRPAWSPDGKTILYQSILRSPPLGNADIYAVNVDGTNDRRLTRYAGWDDWPHWSPDGTKILFARGPSMLYPEVSVMNPDGRAFRRLTNSPTVPRHRIAFVRFFTKPKLPHAGKLFTATLDVVEIQDVEFGRVTIRCQATIGKRAVRVVRRSFSKEGRSRCTWRIPAGTKGKILRGTMSARSGDTAVPAPFRRKIR